MASDDLRVGDCRDVMRAMDADSVDAIASDPPYGLGFMARDWDHAVPGTGYWAEALRVAKPGAHLVACGGTRTYHRLVCAIEDAGWVIRDSLQWLYGAGFPKSKSMGKAGWIDLGPWPSPNAQAYADAERLAADWDAWGTALKPAYEPIVLARKPFRGSVADNVLTHGCGALNVDGCRIAAHESWKAKTMRPSDSIGTFRTRTRTTEQHSLGRWPANVILGCACEVEHDPGCAVAMLDAQAGATGQRGDLTGSEPRSDGFGSSAIYGDGKRAMAFPSRGDTGGASRFFYTAKASRAEREAGLEHQRGDTQRANTHPTVKPVSLMRWLVRLITPPGGTVLDPFMGSGTTGIACVLEGFFFVGVDIVPKHVDIARSRIARAREDAGSMTSDQAEERAAETGGPVQIGLGLSERRDGKGESPDGE